MEGNKRVLAFDFGASSGRAMIGTFDGEEITLQEIHRFTNDPVTVSGTMHWDVLRLFYEIKQGIIKAKLAGGFDSIGIDTWGVDFGLLDEEGRLLENPVHYRDARTTGLVEESFQRIAKEEFYKITGIQFMEINTAFQLFYLSKNRPQLLERAKTMLLMPDLFNYFLTDQKCSEYSICSTTQLLDAKEKNWSTKVLNALDIPSDLMTQIIPSGTTVGNLSAEICEELGVEAVPVIAVCGHDTQSAMVSVPTQESDFLFISCGTWSLFGTENDMPIINEKSELYNITNEGGYQGKASFLKNIIGLWLVQESRRQWQREGKDISFGELEVLAKDAKPFRSLIDPDAPEFVPSGNLPRRIREFCKRTGQEIPETEGEIVRCINESLALKYRFVFEQMKECTGKEYAGINMIGGGIQSKLLCQMTANACRCPVTAGPVEATVFGNVALQLLAAGVLTNLQEARAVIEKSPDIAYYQPQDQTVWEEAYQRFMLLG